jgi:hypothetical protein
MGEKHAGRGSACAKALGHGGAARRLCGWSRGSEGDGGRRRQGGDRQVRQGPVGCREDLGFEPEGGGSHGGLWAGEGGPGSAHERPLVAVGGQAVGG